MATSPTQRTKKWLLENGWIFVDITEKWNAWAKIRQDLFGCIDLLAIRPGRMLGVQTTTGDNHANRRTKILSSEKAKMFVESGAELWIITWRKTVKNKWEVRVEEFNVERFDI